MAISAIMPAITRHNVLVKVIESITHYANEVLVIYDGSKDDTSKAAKAAGASVIRRSTVSIMLYLNEVSASQNMIL